jgi:hypothetical protein
MNIRPAGKASRPGRPRGELVPPTRSGPKIKKIWDSLKNEDRRLQMKHNSHRNIENFFMGSPEMPTP